MNNIKLMVVGDSLVGKTCLLTSYTENIFHHEHILNLELTYKTNKIFDDIEFILSIWDTDGAKDNEVEIRLSSDTNCFLVCYAVDQLSSYENVHKRWIPQLRKLDASIPIALVATKIDLRHNFPTCLTKENGIQLKKKVKADSYVECSALYRQGVNEVFLEALKIVYKPKTEKCKCRIF